MHSRYISIEGESCRRQSSYYRHADRYIGRRRACLSHGQARFDDFESHDERMKKVTQFPPIERAIIATFTSNKFQLSPS